MSVILEEILRNVKRYFEEGVAQLLSTRSRLIVTGILLCLALGATIFCAMQTVQAIQHFQQVRTLDEQKDVRTIQPWMSIHYISRVYTVPESYLYEELHFTDPHSIRHLPLSTIAMRYNLALDGFIRTIQTVVKTYRKQHPDRPSYTELSAGELLFLERRMT
jgi:hypothetical protein